MTTFIKGATILAIGGRNGKTPFEGDILIQKDRIVAIGTGLTAPDGARIIDGSNRLVMPGLVNAHLHSSEALFKGRYDNLPLEMWMLYSWPIFGTRPLDPRLIYLRSILVAIESLKTGVTSITDDIYEPPQQTIEQLGAVVDAYEDIGIRATVSGNIADKNFLDTIPFSREHIPASLVAELENLPLPTVADYVEFAKAAHSEFHGRSGRIRFMVAPSAPQRCTPELLRAAHRLALEWKVPFHTHVVETKLQHVTGDVLYGKSLIRYLHDLGLLDSGTTIGHSIWVTDEDIRLMAEAGVSVVHNTISNQKLGAGIAPVRKLLDAGVNVALGSDGVCSSDSPRLFDVVRACGLIHNVTTPDFSRWLNANEILHAATLGGARSALIDDETGSLEVGKKADLLILNLNAVNFTPLNDIRNHLVYCENGSSIEKVFVDGDIVVENGELTRVDELALLDEIRSLISEFKEYHLEVERKNSRLAPYIKEIHDRGNRIDIGFDRLAGDGGY